MARDDRLASDHKTDGYLNVHVHYSLKSPVSLERTVPAHAFDNALT